MIHHFHKPWSCSGGNLWLDLDQAWRLEGGPGVHSNTDSLESIWSWFFPSSLIFWRVVFYLLLFLFCFQVCSHLDESTSKAGSLCWPPNLKLEKAMAPHSSTLAWKIPWTEEPGRLQSMWSLRVGHDWVTSLSLFTFMHWRRKWQPTPVFLPGESQGWGTLVGCCLWGRTESDTTEVI